MTDVTISFVCDLLCLGLSIVFFWSTFIVLVGLIKPVHRHPRAERKFRFAVLICARNEESVIRLPVRSALMSRYPAESREVIVLADNCSDRTAERARDAGATVWEKTEPSAGKGDVLAWGIRRLQERGGFDAIAVFDADNIVSDGWFEAMNDALNDGETVVTGRRQSSNARTNVISGWYTVYWSMMNELSNRVRTNLGLSGKLTGTGFAFLVSAMGRVAAVPAAGCADERPGTVQCMWRPLRRWAAGGWQVVRLYAFAWILALLEHPSIRLFDSFFAILTGMSVAFILLFNVVAFIVRVCLRATNPSAVTFFIGVFGFLFVMGWFTAWASVALSPQKRRPHARCIATFPIFSLILSAAVLYALIRPTRTWKPIPHTGN